ncbi:dimethylamine/trimethylamine dehydrogenase [Shimia gijangensis]|uniref:Dimethylamine/trimethylamine dehydrogenase n=1 Tax=Shimia gijangensis TaxID=1470563 RepID=A0A1M6S0K7_9RHOB|nr:FAD-dependent oxidoreductase [Shimia gijangensis]SHK38352.1 dimethylamine/trimethylamine dehydrogenase [Shimia gijangensis]
MTRDPRYDILFQPMKIGPVITPNRFYQVPHCTGMGWQRPRTLAHMRGVKAEGGWGVVNTEYCSIHPSSDDTPNPCASLWNDSDIRAHRLMTDKVHAHGSLAGAELWYGGIRTANLTTREVGIDLGSYPNSAGHPFQTRAMDKTDIRMFRDWHRKAALRAKEAEFDVVYVYATHGYMISNFLSPTLNTRGDEYGGSLENRVRFVRELIEDTKEAVGDRCAVAVRFSADEEIGKDGTPIFGDRREMFEMLANTPDLWDINIADYSLEMGVSRYVKEAPLEPYMDWVKSVTDKPVVTVGRFTSPDTMASQIKRGVTDFIGAARPSIADPFLPNKIKNGQVDSIRECIGCNMCYAGDSLAAPIRCTQNPTMGEEWRKGWHPEKIEPKHADEKVLIVGSGPAGLEAARALGHRGYEVMLAEAGRELGGRVTRESALIGMSEYARVRNYRQQDMAEMANVDVFLESPLGVEDVMAVEADHVVVATGAKWNKTRFDWTTYRSVAPEGSDINIFTPDDIMDGTLPTKGPVLIYDEDSYYMGGVIAETLTKAGLDVIIATPADKVSAWTEQTSERWRIHTSLMKLGVGIELSHGLDSYDGATATLVCEYSGNSKKIRAASLVMVTQRTPNDALYQDLLASVDGNIDALPFSLGKIGDCDAPAVVAAATYAGHRYARELGAPYDVDQMRHDRVDVGETSDAPKVKKPSTRYLETLCKYYEEEVEGEAYFHAIAERLKDPENRRKMTVIAEVEAFAAQSVRPLIEKYGLSPRDHKDLLKSGRDEAARASASWADQIAEMTRSFPGYVDDFLALEQMAPPEDLPRLKLLTEHEVAAIAFLNRENAGLPASEKPMLTYLGRIS